MTMTTAAINGTNQVSQGNTARVEKTEPALTAPSTGAIEQDANPTGVSYYSGRSVEKNCMRKSRRMQEMLGMMAGALAT